MHPHTKALEAIHSPPVGSKPFTSKFLMSRPFATSGLKALHVKNLYAKALEAFIRRQWAQSPSRHVPSYQGP